ncbi:response regulator [Fulvivirga sp. RKSG066]|uniref:response regulator n=1 Tax=Fulvivirga aurantia TaxID=2529383 RepID=UPI0012BC2F25|nr:response regulator [Fulvivirga aurantia]MTI20938.1 response regulator [Fulvivirga aurantia]
MSLFSLSRVDKLRNQHKKSDQDIINIKFPSELKPQELLIYIVEDDPSFLQQLNTHFSKLKLEVNQTKYRFKVKNYTTGTSCLKDLKHNPDLIFLNFFLNKGVSHTISGRETFDQIMDANPNQKVIILNELEVKLRGAFVENGLRDYIIKDEKGLEELNTIITDILS